MSELGFTMEYVDRPRRRLAPWILMALALALIAGIGLSVVTPSVGSGAQFAGPGSGSVQVQVANGASVTEIANTLLAAGVISSTQDFVSSANGGSSIAPGVYTLHSQMGAPDAYQLMLDPKSRTGSRLVIKEGQRLKEIVAEASRVTGIAVSEFNSALSRPESYGLPAAAGGDPEGWLFPATYDIAPKATATSVLKQMTQRFAKTAESINLDERAKALGLTTEQVVTIASIVSVEVNPSDYSKAARVIDNRMKQGMRLGLDSTVNYALGISKAQLSADELAVDSPYNTYQVHGLPPGPINSPGEAALEAALSPALGKWLYFITTDQAKGTTVFTETEAEFLKIKKQIAQPTS